MASLPRIALIGRPNVGKSTLFNKMVGKHMAIVNDQPGVTRDFKESKALLFSKEVILIDTAGLEDHFDDSMFGRMRQQTEKAIETADVLVFIIDGREGVTPMDEHFARWLRKQKHQKILVVNKCESAKGDAGIAESYRLGFGDPIPMSAEHGHGFSDLYDAVMDVLPKDQAEAEGTDEEDERTTDSIAGEGDEAYPSLDFDAIEGDEEFVFEDLGDDPEKPLKVSIIGRPNVGKSTLVNALLEDNRVMTGPEAGVTRDSIAIDWEYAGRKFKLVDTAGLRKKSRVTDVIEKMSVEDSYRAIRLSQIVVLVLDGTLGIDRQDLHIAAHAIEEGRALVIAVNKWDLIDDKVKCLEDIQYRLEISLSQTKDVPIQTLSALNGKNIHKLMDRLLDTYAVWNKRASTGRMNRWLEAVSSHHPPSLVKGRANKLRYITQINTRPPTFAMWLSHPKALPDSYKRYIINSLRDDFDIPGVPIRLLLRKSKNPYANRKRVN